MSATSAPSSSSASSSASPAASPMPPPQVKATAKADKPALRIPQAAAQLVERAMACKRPRSPETQEQQQPQQPSDPNSWAGKMAAKTGSKPKVARAAELKSSEEDAMVDAAASSSSSQSQVTDTTLPASASQETRDLLALFFLGMVRGVAPSTVRQMTAAAWESNPELTLQILMHARDAREGKGEKAVVLEALLWLREHKPRTYCRNLLEFLRLGYFKDLLAIATEVIDRRLPLMQTDAATKVPLEVEVLAEFLREDQDAMRKFRERQALKEATDGVEKIDMADVEPVAKTAVASSASAPAPSSAAVAPAEEDFEMLAAPSSSAATSAKKDAAEFAVVPRSTMKIDLCFVIDATGSMGPWLEAVKTTVLQLVAQMKLEGERSGVAEVKIRLGLLAYHDYFDTPLYERKDFTLDHEAFLGEVKKLHPRGGADTPEDMIRGLEEALKFEWDDSDDTTRMLLLIADAPCHGVEFSRDDSAESTKHLKEHPEDPRGCIERIRARKIHFTFTRITESTDVMLEKFQGWFDDRRARRVMNVLQLGQRVQKFLPMVMEQLTLAALGRKPTIEVEEEKEEEPEVVAEPTDADTQQESKDDSASSSSSAPAAKRSKRKSASESVSLSLAGKWTPTEKSHYDAPRYKFAAGLARLLFPGSKAAAKQYRVLCSTLRSQLQVVERLMCTQQWSGIDFARVPARCHKLLKKAFAKHEPTRYAQFLGRVKKGEVTIKVAGLQPHDLTEAYRTAREVKVDETTEAQWKAMAEKLKATIGPDAHTNALAVLDTSGSMTWNSSGMSGIANAENKMATTAPIDAALALGLLISQMTRGAFRDRVLTFAEEPKWVVLPDSEKATLCERVDALYSAACDGGSTNVSACLEMILSVAVANRCPPSDLPTALFILSDMDLNTHVSKGKLNLPVMRTKYESAGYRCPEVVLWNLDGDGRAAAQRLQSVPWEIVHRGSQ